VWVLSARFYYDIGAARRGELWYSAAMTRPARFGVLPLLVFVLVHCSPMEAEAWPEEPDAGTVDLGGPTEDAGEGDMARPPQPARTFLLTLDKGAFAPSPDHPSALVYLPAGFDPKPPVSLVVYIHGFNNCVENVVRKLGEAKACTPGGAARNPHELITQLEASGKKAMLLVPEVAFDRASADPGTLGTVDGFRALLEETLQKLSTPLAGLRLSGIGAVAVASHSGGYQAAAGIAMRGGVPVSEVYLLDSLYGSSADFEAWIRQDLPALSGSLPKRRFASVYTDGGGTLTNNQSLARAAAAFVPDPAVLIDDRTTATWPLETYHHGLLFKRSMLTHDAVPRYYFQTLVTTSGL
jgi:pimeloyl-ACP methyl ester carboxylesterase